MSTNANVVVTEHRRLSSHRVVCRLTPAELVRFV